MNCRLDLIQYVYRPTPVHIGPTAVSGYDLTYFIQGNGVTRTNGNQYRYTPKSFAVFRPGVWHEEDHRECLISIFTHFDFDLPGVELREGLFADKDDRLLASLRKLRQEVLNHNDFSEQMQATLLLTTIVEAARLQQTDQDNGHHQLDNWSKVLSYIDENYHTDIDFVTLAAQCGYSYDRFRHLFAKSFGCSPARYLNNRRLEIARLMITTSDSSMTQIALDCGFSSSSQFSNTFLKHFGITPMDYRKGAASS